LRASATLTPPTSPLSIIDIATAAAATAAALSVAAAAASAAGFADTVTALPLLPLSVSLLGGGDDSLALPLQRLLRGDDDAVGVGRDETLPRGRSDEEHRHHELWKGQKRKGKKKDRKS
jgi:hypothetical protein